jgi:hypothetical protein
MQRTSSAESTPIQLCGAGCARRRAAGDWHERALVVAAAREPEEDVAERVRVARLYK